MSDAEIIANYAHSLPELYQEIFRAFPSLEPERRLGYGLTFQTISDNFDAKGKKFSLGQVIKAANELEKYGLAQIKHRNFLVPSSTGEAIIGALTGHHAEPETIPPLPPPPTDLIPQHPTETSD